MKTFTTQEIRDLYDRFYREEISFTRMVEILNERVSEAEDIPAQSDNINKYGIDLSILNEEDWFYAELYSGHVKWLNRGKMFDRDDRESISYQCEKNEIYKEGRLCRKDDIRVLRKATPSDLAPFFEKHPEYEPVNKNITATCNKRCGNIVQI